MTVQEETAQETAQETPMEEEVDISKAGEGDHDVHHDDHGHDHHHSEECHFYTRPRQRQKWGESQAHPHTNFNDLFFDLFYVAAAYNLGSLIRASPTSLGFLYFMGCFYPIMMLWFQKTMYDSRFDAGNDLYHKMYEFFVLLVLATTVLYIRPVAYLSTPSANEDMLVFATCITLSCFLAMGRCVDVIRNVDGEPCAKKQGAYDLKVFGVMAVFYIAATVLAALDYFDGGSSDDSYGATSDAATTDTNSTEGIRRALAAAGDYGDTNHIPIILLVVGSLMYNVGTIIAVFRSSIFRNFNPQESSVPMNIGFFIHRFGEWILLMLGESVLSLLIVPTERGDYYKAFFCGILSISILEVLYFQSQPHDADDHALRRSRWGGIVYINFGQIYSAALIVLGTSYKMILYEFVYAHDAGDTHRLLHEVGYTSKEILEDPSVHRFLASAGPPIDDTEVRQQHVAHFFCISMAIVWLCLDVMLLAHKGIEFNLKRCERRSNKRQKFFSIGMALIRGSLIVFFGTMSFYITEPTLLAFLGLLGIIVQVGLRVAGSAAFDETDLQECSKSEYNINGPKALFRQKGTRQLNLFGQE